VIAGELKGLRLSSPAGLHTRPTPDRVKESVFNILGARVAGSRFLDLFAGSGAIGIEALSRGADEAVFVDDDPAAIGCIRANLIKTKLIGKAKVIAGDAKSAIRSMLKVESFGIIYLDPPFGCGALVETLNNPGFAKLLKPDGLIIIESQASAKATLPDGLRTADLRKYGSIQITMAEKIIP